jgi:dTDP-4-amino-4,6-dideoxygalactose transaminase
MSDKMKTSNIHQAVSSVVHYVEDLLAHPQAMRGQMLRGTGPVAEFEQLLGQRCGFPYCLATCNATSALLTAVLAAGLSGKSVAIMDGAWLGSLGVLRLAGVHEVPFDKSPAFDMTSCSAVLAADPSDGRHDTEAIRELCDESGIWYIEDTGWLPGFAAPTDDRSLADIQVLSFGPGKAICLGEGGAVLCRDESFYHRAVALSQHPERAMAEHGSLDGVPLLNARMHPLAAVIGVELLRRRDDTHCQPVLREGDDWMEPYWAGYAS